MTRYSVAEAKNTLPSLIDKAVAGEAVVITRHGKPIAELRPMPPEIRAPTPGVYEWLRKRREARPPAPMTSVELLNAMYDEGRE